jgi:hypothetical protein
LLDPDGKNIDAVLRRRSQFTPEPARYFLRFHRIDKVDHALMNMIANVRMSKPDGPGVIRASASSFCTSGMVVFQTRP